MELTKIEFEDGQKISDAYVEINGVKHNVTKAQYQGKTPLSARNLNKMQDNMETAISDLDERVVSYRNVLVDEQALIKECGGLKLKKLNKLVGKTEQEGEPTPENPSEVKTVTGNVEVGINNGNLFDFNVNQDTRVKYNADGTITINGNGGFFIKFNKLNLKKGEIYYQKIELVSGTVTGASASTGETAIFSLDEKTRLSSISFISYKPTEDKAVSGLWVHANAVFTNAVIKIWCNKDKSDFVKGESQVFPLTLGDILLYEGNKIYKENGKWYKYIEWFKEILESNKIWNVSGTYIGSLYTGQQKFIDNVGVYCNIAKGVKNLSEYAEGCCVIANSSIHLWIPGLSTPELLNEYLANNEVYIVGKLKTPIIEEITDTTLIAQLNALENAKLYEGITNITITGDNLTPILDIDYWTWFKGEDAKTDVTDYEISNLPEHSGGANSYMLKKTGNIVVLAVDNIWVNSITANTWIDIGTVPEELRPEKTIQGLVVGSRGDSGNVGAYGKIGITADGVVRCKMNSDINLLSAFSFNIMWII